MTDQQDKSLPEIPDVTTLIHNVPHLSFSDLQLYWSVGRPSRRTTTETLIDVKHRDDDCNKPVASLYSMKNKAFYRLPPIPPSLGVMSRFSQFLTKNGTLYVFKAGCNCNCSASNHSQTKPPISNGPCTSYRDAKRVFMLDLAGQGQWEEWDGNQATPAPPLVHRKTCRLVCISLMERETFLREGCTCCFLSSWFQLILIEVDGVPRMELRMIQSDSQELALDEVPQSFFVADGKEYLVNSFGNHDHLYSRVRTLQTFVHSMSNQIEPATSPATRTINDPGSHPVEVKPLFIIPANNELVAIAHWRNMLGDGYCMIQTRGFGQTRTEISWERVPHSSSFFNGDTTFSMCPIQLERVPHSI